MKTFLKHSAASLAALLGTILGLQPSASLAQLPLGTAGVAATSQVAPAPQSGVSPVETAEEEMLTDTDLICVVGSEHILAGDMRIIYEPYIEKLLGSITPAQEKMLRQRYTRETLKQYVAIKALYQEFFRENAGGTAAPHEVKEAQKKIINKARMIFFNEQVPNLLKSHKVTDLKGLEEKLRTKSMSVKQVEQQFIERVLASELERRHVPKVVDISREELMQYYKEHAEDWDKPGRAKWRQLTARFDRFPSQEAARAAIDAMGNEVYLGGKPFEAVARTSSHGFTADEGGMVDWTTQGSLKSKQLDEAIFSIPLQRLSKVIEDDIGFHIIEVLEREEATTLSFEAAQEEMRKALTESKTDQLRQAYHDKVMERTVIWTRWPEDIPGSRSLAEVIEDSPLTSVEPSR